MPNWPKQNESQEYDTTGETSEEGAMDIFLPATVYTTHGHTIPITLRRRVELTDDADDQIRVSSHNLMPHPVDGIVYFPLRDGVLILREDSIAGMSIGDTPVSDEGPSMEFLPVPS